MALYEIICLSAVHVGTGEHYTRFEGVYADGQWSLVDLDRVLSAGADAAELATAMGARDFDWAAYLQRRGIPLSAAAAPGYPVPCATDPGDTELRPFMRDAAARPYLPGSTLKGAIRTSLFQHLVKPDDLRRFIEGALQDSRQRREWLGRPLEKLTLGQDPNHDLFRALHVGDSQPFAATDISIGSAWTYTVRGGKLEEKREGTSEYRVLVETLQVKARAQVQIHLDARLLGAADDGTALYTDGQRQALTDFAAICTRRSRQLLEREAEFCSTHGVAGLAGYYRQLVAYCDHTPPGAFITNIGWGGGYNAKTIGDLIRNTVGEEQFDQLRHKYRIGENPRTRGYNAEFPKTRRIAYRVGAAATPMGWIGVRPAKRG